MDALIGRRLVKVVRLAWHWADEPDDLGVGPAQLVFDEGRGLLVASRSDWTLKLVETCPGDDTWLDPYNYDYDGGRWLSRDASAEPPFASVIARPLADLGQIRNEIDEVVGIRLDFDGQILTLKTWQGEIKT
ncbi:hypothetical protein KZZ52_26980 [Dactylosporangium sp. AC04546]|uniref:hypothetical protein n=1 Tax=Dactylosporangium sp. AC04546 TaxID=2862460 RepID=UPI001EE0B41E|nr:hypothetical protein [Dactylosporangium sp. AC04546]WVK88911.1 hypothetical protein KZZ52_26980 [Dactylosporangium sp. AC04546]